MATQPSQFDVETVAAAAKAHIKAESDAAGGSAVLVGASELFDGIDVPALEDLNGHEVLDLIYELASDGDIDVVVAEFGCILFAWTGRGDQPRPPAFPEWLV